MKKIVSTIIKIIITLGSVLGIILHSLSPYGKYLGTKTLFLFFTIQSNIWICLVMLLLLIIKILEFKTKTKKFKRWMYLLKLIFTVSISLTGIVFCTMLAPYAPPEVEIWDIGSILMHVVVPLLAVIDLFLDNYSCNFKIKEVLLVILPPLYYLIFSIIGFLLNWDFGEGHNYPYFFLNFNSQLGVFGISSTDPYLGSFYWILILLILVLGMGLIYIVLFNKLNSQNKKLK